MFRFAKKKTSYSDLGQLPARIKFDRPDNAGNDVALSRQLCSIGVNSLNC